MNEDDTLQQLKAKQDSLKTKRDKTQKRKYQAKQKRDRTVGKIQPLPSEKFSQKTKPQTYQEPWWFFLLSLGLCFVLFLGINELVRISLRNAQLFQLPFFVLSFIVAFLAALATKKVMTIAAYNSQHSALIAQNFQSKSVAWWLRLSKGNGAFYLGLFLIPS